MRRNFKDIFFSKSLINLLVVIAGTFIMAFSFNAFYLPNDIVTGGISGLSIAVNGISGFDTAIFITIVNILLLILCTLSLGLKQSINTIIGTIFYSLFVYLTKDVSTFLNLGINELILNIIIGASLVGIGAGLVYRVGYNSGGVDIIALIISKYFKKQIGKSQRIINCLVILSGAFVFGINLAIYGIIANIIETILIDRIILGISDSKMFLIVTDKEKEVIEFIKNELGAKVTIMKAKNDRDGKEKDMIMCTISTQKYFELRKRIMDIDNQCFIAVTDCYEVLGGDNGEEEII